jgi:hypothetical protein
LIGVYATEEDANSALDRIRVQPGFRDYLEGFEINKYEIGKDQWEEGYFTTTTINAKATTKAGPCGMTNKERRRQPQRQLYAKRI